MNIHKPTIHTEEDTHEDIHTNKTHTEGRHMDIHKPTIHTEEETH